MDKIETIGECSPGARKGGMENHKDPYLFLRGEDYEEEKTIQ